MDVAIFKYTILLLFLLYLYASNDVETPTEYNIIKLTSSLLTTLYFLYMLKRSSILNDTRNWVSI